MAHGWLRMKIDPYDDRYYRVWMHEIPPLRHRERKTEIDLHHTILPRTSRLKPDPCAAACRGPAAGGPKAARARAVRHGAAFARAPVPGG